MDPGHKMLWMLRASFAVASVGYLLFQGTWWAGDARENT